MEAARRTCLGVRSCGISGGQSRCPKPVRKTDEERAGLWKSTQSCTSERDRLHGTWPDLPECEDCSRVTNVFAAGMAGNTGEKVDGKRKDLGICAFSAGATSRSMTGSGRFLRT